jgi:hypothetical protein
MTSYTSFVRICKIAGIVIGIPYGNDFDKQKQSPLQAQHLGYFIRLGDKKKKKKNLLDDHH